MSIPPRFLTELRDRLTLSDIIGRRMKLTRAGREHKGCCPFHHEKTPSFTVNDDKQFYHCFGCGAHGDVLGFVMEHDNLSFIDAVEMLAAEAGMQVPKQSPQEIKKAKQEKTLHNLLEDVTSYFESCLHHPSNREALQYMLDRGTQNLLAPFRIGYAPNDPQALRKHLLASDYTDKQMIEAGVMRPSKKGGEPYAFFRDRIMFPVRDRRGRVVAFGGRILPDHLRPPQQGSFTPPKYMNSSDSDLFHKGRMLYNENFARQAVADGQTLVVVEGYTDVMALYGAGFQGAVAPLGTALTEDQIQILWKMIPDAKKMPVLCFDGDNAGRRAAARAAERILPLLQPNQSALFAFLPEGQDPDSLVKSQGAGAFQAVIDAALPLADFLWLMHTDGKRFETPEERAGLAKTLEDETNRITDRSVQNYYRQMLKEKLYRHYGGFGGRKNTAGYNYNDRFGKRGFGTAGNRNKGQSQGQGGGMMLRRPAFSAQRLPQMIFLACIINHPAIFPAVEDDLAGLKIENQRLDRLRQEVINFLLLQETLDTKDLQSHLNKAGYEAELQQLLSPAVYTHAAFARPTAELADAQEGWQAIKSMVEGHSVSQEIVEKWRSLNEDFSKEKEDRILALHDVNKIVDG